MVLERKILLVQIILHASFIVLGIATFSLSSLIYLLTDTEVQPYFLSDNVLLLFSGVVQMYIGTFLLIQSMYQWRYMEPPERCNSGCCWFLFILASAILLGISIALPAGLNDTSTLENDLHSEVSANSTSSGLLSFGHYKTGCCGVDYEINCSHNYPPVTNGTYACAKGSLTCQYPCLEAIWDIYIHPVKILVASLGIASLVLEVLEFFLPTVLRRIFWRYSAAAAMMVDPADRPPIRTSDPQLDEKIKLFYEQLYGDEDQRRTNTSDIVSVNVVRQTTLENSLDQLILHSPERWKNKFKISFADEEGIDYGGLLKEWFTILVRQILNPNFVLFRKVRADGVSYTIDEKSSYIHSNNNIQFYKFAGLVVAKAIYEKIPLQFVFAQSIYKRMLGLQVTPSDLEFDDPHLYLNIASLTKMSADELKEADLYFVSEVSAFGEVIKQTDLAPYDRTTPVTPENVKEYTDLLCMMKMTGEIEEQLTAFLVGFHALVPQQLVSAFTPRELELLICGDQKIDIGDIKTYALYHNCSRDTPQVQWLWKALESFTEAERTRFLLFVTGSDRVPLGGFCGSDGGQQFTVLLITDRAVDQLPTAHTCFNRIELARYPSYEILRERLLKAITECGEGFGLK